MFVESVAGEENAGKAVADDGRNNVRGMRAPVISLLVLMAALGGAVAARAQTSPFESPGPPVPQGEIDTIVFGRLKQLDIPPANLCSDAVFVRRVYLDVIGTLPAAREASSFLLATTPTSAPNSLNSCWRARSSPITGR